MTVFIHVLIHVHVHILFVCINFPRDDEMATYDILTVGLVTDVVVPLTIENQGSNAFLAQLTFTLPIQQLTFVGTSDVRGSPSHPLSFSSSTSYFSSPFPFTLFLLFFPPSLSLPSFLSLPSSLPPSLLPSLLPLS